MLDLAILGLLKDQDLHGYELKKQLTEILGPWSRVSFGSLYPALGRLEAAGAVRAVAGGADAEPIPMTGSLDGELAAFRARRGAGRNGRSRKVYGITARGEELFTTLLAADTPAGDDDRTFSLRLAFARFLPPERRMRMLERRRAQLVERLERAREALAAGRERDPYARSLAEHTSELAEHDISWLDRLIAAERTSSRKGGNR